MASFYENIADDIIEYIYNNKPYSANQHCYWVTGYSIAGGIAGEIASRLSDEAEVYCYTFGATNTNTTGSGAYACIKNVINEDDLYPKIYNVEDGFYRSGMLYNDSIYDNLKQEYRQLVGNVKKYNVTPKLTNTIKKKLNKVRDNVTYTNYVNDWNTELSSYLKHYFKILNVFYVGFDNDFHPFQSHYSTELVNILNNNIDEVKIGHEIESYYVLSKSLDGFDLNNQDEGWTEFEEDVISDNEESDDQNDHIYVEVDWMSGCEPDQLQLELVVESFKEHNIMLHIDAGEYSVNYDGESKSNVLKGLNNEKILRLGDDIDTIKSLVKSNFSDRKNFRYCMYIKEIRPSLKKDKNPNEYTLGIADDIPGKMFILSKEIIELYKNVYYSNQEAATFTHELGHTLGLCHGGDEHIIYKPNHVSIMNYAYTNYRGLIAENEINYSEYEFPEMDFNHINETKGIDPNKIGKKIKGIKWILQDKSLREVACEQSYKQDTSIDFNNNGKIEKDVKINFHLEYGTIWEIVKSFIIPDKCKKSTNEWDVVYKRIKPKNKVNYKWFKQDNNEEVN